jgi:hypothetical protein
MTRTTALLPVIGLLCALPAQALPPPTAPPYTATYKHTMKETDEDGESTTTSETTTISVSKDRARSERQRDEFVSLQDRSAKKVTVFGGNLPPKTAFESPLRSSASWEFGYGTIAAASTPPRETGTDTVAGKPCTVLEFDSAKFGKPKLCVTEEGVVARFFLDDADDGSVTTFEAKKITLGEPPADRFTVPAGYTVGRAPRP